MTSKTSSASEYFTASVSSEYDRKIRAGIPGYESLHAMSSLLMKAVLPKQSRILVVGAGTGMELVTMGRANPEWKFTAVDVSQDMLSQCEENVRRHGLSNRVSVYCGELSTLDAGQGYDAATSILVSHFIRDSDARAAFFRSVADSLVDDGILVTADIVADTPGRACDVFVTAWRAHYASAGIPAGEAEADCDRSLEAVSLVPESAVLNLLAAAGFRTIRQFYRAFMFAGWLCAKSVNLHRAS